MIKQLEKILMPLAEAIGRNKYFFKLFNHSFKIGRAHV